MSQLSRRLSHVGAVGWEPLGRSLRTCAGIEGGSWVGVCVPLALSLSFENRELNFSTAYRI